MAFTRTTMQPIGGQGRAGAAPQLWAYRTADLLSAVAASGYFNTVASLLRAGDLVAVNANSGLADDQFALLRVAAISGAGVVTTTHSNVNQTRVVDLAVTAVATTEIPIDLPRCFILSALQRTTTAYGAATNANLTLGTTAGGTDVVAAVDVKTKGVRSLTLVDASCDVFTPFAGGTLYGRITQVGTASATGAGKLILSYLAA